MGAHWHLFLPIKISSDMTKEKYDRIEDKHSILPKEYIANYKQITTQEYVDNNSVLGKRQKITINYTLSDAKIQEIKPFLIEAWRLVKVSDSEMENFINETFLKFNLSTISSLEDIKEQLNKLENNYYLSYESILGMYVYHGWPDSLNHPERTYCMSGFIFDHSNDKMNVIPEETVAFYNAKEKIHSKLCVKYDIAKFVETVGF